MIYQVFDKKQACYVYTLAELVQMYDEGRLQLREPNKVQVRQIRAYIVDNIATGNIYLPPIVARIAKGQLQQQKPEHLMVIDGSQRLKALLSFPQEVPKLIYSKDDTKIQNGFILRHLYPDMTVAFQVFEGLTAKEADQLYLDLNTRGKKVALSKRIAYDSRDDINVTTNRLLQNHKKLKIAGIETEKVAVKRPNNKNFMSLSQLRNVVGIFITGKDVESKLSIKMDQDTNFKDALCLVELWLDELFTLYPPNKIGDYHVSMLASYPLQLALVHYALEGTKGMSMQQKQQIIQQRMQRLSGVDWSREQLTWLQFNGVKQGKDDYYHLRKDKKNIHSIVKWLNQQGGE